MSRRDRKKQEQLEIQAIMEEEGILDEEEGKQADDLEKLTGKPHPEDALLYAVPMCGPYSSLKDFKFKVKLTPGTAKKGKAAKQAVELFAYSKECSATERTLMKALTDPEMVAIMMGDVKLSMPGLFQAKRQKKGKK
jgi:NFACT protein C-terminal domain